MKKKTTTTLQKQTTTSKKKDNEVQPTQIVVTSDKESEIIRHEYGTETPYKNILFRSKFEAEIAKYLDELGLRWEYETMSLPYIPRVSMYTPDFKVWRPNGDEKDWFLIETKGYFDVRSRQKMMQIRRQYPDYDIKLFFQKPNLLVGGAKKMTYVDWSKKYDYDVISKSALASLVGREIQSAPTKPTQKTKNKKKQKKSTNEKVSM